MFDIGSSLREARTRQGLAFDEMEQRTKVRAKYLRFLEEFWLDAKMQVEEVMRLRDGQSSPEPAERDVIRVTKFYCCARLVSRGSHAVKVQIKHILRNARIRIEWVRRTNTAEALQRPKVVQEHDGVAERGPEPHLACYVNSEWLLGGGKSLQCESITDSAQHPHGSTMPP